MATTSDQIIARGDLWQRLKTTTEAAIACTALHRIESRLQVILDGGIPFIVRVAGNLRRKVRETSQQDDGAASFDPFLPPEPALTVGAIGKTHIAVLNKYNVVPNHLLIVTRHFEEQERLLTRADLAALCWCLREIDGLGFYNGGTVAGASQTHKHLQLIPTLATEGTNAFPVEAALSQTLATAPHHLATLCFPHRIAGLPPGLFEAPAEAAAHCHSLYRNMLIELGQGLRQDKEGMDYQSAPYNLLLTRRWLMLVPRTREHFGNISINSMGFAGSLFVTTEEAMVTVREAGPMKMLQAVSS